MSSALKPLTTILKIDQRATDRGNDWVSTGERVGDASGREAKRLRIDIAGGLSREGCGSGSRLVLAHRREPLSDCRTRGFCSHSRHIPVSHVRQAGENASGTESSGMVNNRRGAPERKKPRLMAGLLAWAADRIRQHAAVLLRRPVHFDRRGCQLQRLAPHRERRSEAAGRPRPEATVQTQCCSRANPHHP